MALALVATCALVQRDKAEHPPRPSIIPAGVTVYDNIGYPASVRMTPCATTRSETTAQEADVRTRHTPDNIAVQVLLVPSLQFAGEVQLDLDRPKNCMPPYLIRLEDTRPV